MGKLQGVKPIFDSAQLSKDAAMDPSHLLPLALHIMLQRFL